MRQEPGCLVTVPDLLGAMMATVAMEHVLSAQLVQRQSEYSCVPHALHEKIEHNLIASYVSCVAARSGQQHTSHNTQGDTMIEIEPIYTTEAIATGAGRDGHVQSSDGRVVEDLAVPVEMGGNGKGTNPEQLFAAGYAACFHSALQLVARKAKKDLGDSSVGARVSIGRAGEGFGLAVTLEVVIPNLPHDEVQQLADKAHQVCPYSNATRGNIRVDVTVVDD